MSSEYSEPETEPLGVSFVVLDTDVASAGLRGRLADPLRTRLTGQTWCISFVTVGELTKWTVLRSWGPRKLASLAGQAGAGGAAPR